VQSYAKYAVMTEIEKQSEKNTCRAEAILSGVVSDLMMKGIEDCAVLSKATQEDVGAFILLVQNAVRSSVCIPNQIMQPCILKAANQ